MLIRSFSSPRSHFNFSQQNLLFFFLIFACLPASTLQFMPACLVILEARSGRRIHSCEPQCRSWDLNLDLTRTLELWKSSQLTTPALIHILYRAPRPCMTEHPVSNSVQPNGRLCHGPLLSLGIPLHPASFGRGVIPPGSLPRFLRVPSAPPRTPPPLGEVSDS